MMSYKEARAAADACMTFDEVNELLKRIEREDGTITYRQYYAVKRLALDAVIKNNFE